MIKDNKGFSLVEIILTILIMVIVGGAVVGFLIAGSNSYSAVSTDSDLQKESQITMNQLTDMIIDTSHALSVSDNTNETVLHIYNETFRYILTYKKAESKIYFSKELRDAANTTFTPGEESLMSEYVRNLRIDLTKVESKRRVGIDITIERNDRSYNTTDVISLRNSVIVSDQYDVIYR